MTSDDDLWGLVAAGSQGVLATVARDGRPQLSNVLCVADPGRRVVRVSTTAGRVKARNLARDPRATDTFLGERYRRIARRRGSKRAIVAIGRSILVIVWHLLSDPDAPFRDLGPGFYAARIDPERRRRTHVRQLEALGYTVTLQPAP